MAHTDGDSQLVDRIIARLAETEQVSASEARDFLHKSLCAATCEWYRKQAADTGFDRLAVDAARRQRIGAIIAEVMGPVAEHDARRRIHFVLCGS